MVRRYWLLLWIVVTLPALSQEMTFPGATWETASPESQGFDADSLRGAIGYLESHTGRDRARELFIVRNGRVVHSGEAVDKIHGVWSVTKTFVGTVFGLLIDGGKSPSIGGSRNAFLKWRRTIRRSSSAISRP